jgi:thioredoxin 1
MKNILIVLLLSTILFLQACTNGKSSNSENKNNMAVTGAKSDDSNPMVIHLTKAQFLEKVWDFEKNPDKWVYKGDKPCIVDFYADWCRPCKIAGPILEELANEYKGQIYVYKIDTEKERELAGAFGIQSIPAFLNCPLQGEPQMSSGIASSSEETKKMFKQVIDDFLLGKK